MMVAEFICKSCKNGWYSIPALNLPEKCKECGTRGCLPSKYREANHQEALSAKKKTMVAKYKCDRCGQKWKSINSSGSPKPCQECRRKLLIGYICPYKYRQAKPEELLPKRKFGFFKCDSCSNEWPSAYTWVGKYQECRECGNKVYAHSFQPLKPGGGGGLFQRPHQQDLCQKCRELGYNCRAYTPIAGGRTQEVDFQDDHSVISIASSTSTDISSIYGGGDITPTASDTEDQVDELLTKGIKKLSMK